MVDALTLETLQEFIRQKGRAIVSVDLTGGLYWVISS